MVFDLVTMSPITHLIKPRHFYFRKQPLSQISSHLRTFITIIAQFSQSYSTSSALVEENVIVSDRGLSGD